MVSLGPWSSPQRQGPDGDVGHGGGGESDEHRQGGAAVVREGGEVEQRRDQEGAAGCVVPAEVCERISPKMSHST